MAEDRSEGDEKASTGHARCVEKTASRAPAAAGPAAEQRRSIVSSRNYAAWLDPWSVGAGRRAEHQHKNKDLLTADSHDCSSLDSGRRKGVMESLACLGLGVDLDLDLLDLDLRS